MHTKNFFLMGDEGFLEWLSVDEVVPKSKRASVFGMMQQLYDFQLLISYRQEKNQNCNPSSGNNIK